MIGEYTPNFNVFNRAFRYGEVLADDKQLNRILRDLKKHIKYGFYVEVSEISSEQQSFINDALRMSGRTSNWKTDCVARWGISGPPRQFNQVSLYGPKKVVYHKLSLKDISAEFKYLVLRNDHAHPENFVQVKRFHTLQEAKALAKERSTETAATFYTAKMV